MQAKYFENYKNKLTFLSIFSWIIAVFFTIQNKLLQLTLKTYLNYNLQNTVKFNNISLFWFILWLFTFLNTKFLQQIVLYVYILLNNLTIFTNLFLISKDTSNLNRMVSLITLYTPVKIFFKNIQQVWFYFNYFAFITTYLLLVVCVGLLTN